MTILSDSVLVESKSARDNQLERVSHDRAATILDKVKGRTNPGKTRTAFFRWSVNA